MASFNKVILIGNLTADPELKQTTGGTSVCSFTIAVNRRFAKADQGQQNVDLQYQVQACFCNGACSCCRGRYP